MCFQVSHGAERSNTAQHLQYQLEEEHFNTQHKILKALQQRMHLSPSDNQHWLQGTLDELQGINSELQLSTVQLLKAVPELKQEFEAEVHEVLSQLLQHLGCEVFFLRLIQSFHNRFSCQWPGGHSQHILRDHLVVAECHLPREECFVLFLKSARTDPFRDASPPQSMAVNLLTNTNLLLVHEQGGGGKKIRAWKKISRGVGVPGLAREKKTVAVFS